MNTRQSFKSTKLAGSWHDASTGPQRSISGNWSVFLCASTAWFPGDSRQLLPLKTLSFQNSGEDLQWNVTEVDGRIQFPSLSASICVNLDT